MSGDTLRANPCIDRPSRPAPRWRRSCVGLDPSGSTHTPGYTLQTAGTGEPQVAKDVDHHLLDGVDMTRRRAWSHRYRHDRVAHQLPGPVIGHVTSTIGADDLGPDGLRIHQDVVRIGAHSEGVNVRVLLQEQPVVPAISPEPPLERESVPVADAA